MGKNNERSAYMLGAFVFFYHVAHEHKAARAKALTRCHGAKWA